MRQDILNCKEFTRGAALFTRIDGNNKTGVEAWRRSGPERWMNCVELITPQEGKYYPDPAHVMRRIPADDPRLHEKMEYYLTHGISTFFPGDEPSQILINNPQKEKRNE